MRCRPTLLFSILLISQSIFGQAVYQLKFRSTVKKDTTQYDAYFARFENGSGFMRVSYLSPASKQTVWVETEMQERYAFAKDGSIDTNWLVYEGSKPVIKKGDSKIKFTPFNILFRLDTISNSYEPADVVINGNDQAAASFNLLSAQFLKASDLDKNLLSNFFSEQDDYYNNLVGVKSKGGMLTSKEKETRLLLLVVASTNDSDIGPSCLLDGRLAVETFTNVADYLGIRKRVDTIFGDNYNKANIQAAISRLKPEPNDIIVFYYSGHGFTDPNFKKKEFPFLDLRDPRVRPRPKPEAHTLNIQDIYDTLLKKKARFTLVISDCCNNKVPDKNAIGIPPPAHKDVSGLKWNWNNTKSLFLGKEQAGYLMTAASKGEKATSKNSYGGFFSRSFIASLKTYLGPDKSNPNWYQVMAEAQKQTIDKAYHTYCPLPENPKNVCHQTPKVLFPK
jgi:hypothetical protein